MAPKRPDRDAALASLQARNLSLGDVALAWCDSEKKAALGNRSPSERDRLVNVAGRLGLSLIHTREIVLLAREEGLVK